MRPAVFLDRDGTINEEVGYLNHIDRLRIFPCALAAIRKLNEANIPAVLATNQAGVARGYFPESLVLDIYTKLQEELASVEARLDAMYYCPHHPEGKLEAYRRKCECRKPTPGMLHRAARELDIDLASSFLISDRYQDLSMAYKVGARGVLVMTGYGKGEYLYLRQTWHRQPDYVATDVLEGVRWILEQIGM
jgi:D-glycero-D-manno-heptose 1,7-bisphosphate phosphatase